VSPFLLWPRFVELDREGRYLRLAVVPIPQRINEAAHLLPRSLATDIKAKALSRQKAQMLRSAIRNQGADQERRIVESYDALLTLDP
jgi:hypothetical protein